MYLITVSDVVKEEEVEIVNEQIFSYELFVHESKVKEVVEELNTKHNNKVFSYIQCVINDVL